MVHLQRERLAKTHYFKRKIVLKLLKLKVQKLLLSRKRNKLGQTDLRCSLAENISSHDDVSHDSVFQLLVLVSSQLDGL